MPGMSMEIHFELYILAAQDPLLKPDSYMHVGGWQWGPACGHQKPPGRWGKSRKVEGPEVLQGLSEA